MDTTPAGLTELDLYLECSHNLKTSTVCITLQLVIHQSLSKKLAKLSSSQVVFVTKRVSLRYFNSRLVKSSMNSDTFHTGNSGLSFPSQFYQRVEFRCNTQHLPSLPTFLTQLPFLKAGFSQFGVTWPRCSVPFPVWRVYIEILADGFSTQMKLLVKEGNLPEVKIPNEKRSQNYH